MSATVSFEVMHFKDGHWTIAFVTSDKAEAIMEAKTAELGRHVQAVKVVQQATDEATDEEVSRVVYSGKADEEEKSAKNRAAAATPKAVEQANGAKAEIIHPKKITNFIDRLTMSVEVFGALALVLVVLVLLYVANADAVSEFLDSLFR